MRSGRVPLFMWTFKSDELILEYNVAPRVQHSQTRQLNDQTSLFLDWYWKHNASGANQRHKSILLSSLSNGAPKHAIFGTFSLVNHTLCELIFP